MKRLMINRSNRFHRSMANAGFHEENMISRLMRRRQQNDRIKIEMWLVLAGAVCGVVFLIQGIRFYQYITSPIEYILEAPDSTSDIDSAAIQLADVPAYEAAGVYKDQDITLLIGDIPISVHLKAVSKEYMEAVCGPEGIDTIQSMPVFYVSDQTYREVRKMLDTGREENNDNETSSLDRNLLGRIFDNTEEENEEELQCSYRKDETVGKARLVPLSLRQGMDQADGHYGYMIESGYHLTKGPDGILLWCSKKDLDGSQIQAIRSSGGQIQDSSGYQIREQEKQIYWIELRNWGIIGMMCCGFTWILHKYGK